MTGATHVAAILLKSSLTVRRHAHAVPRSVMSPQQPLPTQTHLTQTPPHSAPNPPPPPTAPPPPSDPMRHPTAPLLAVVFSERFVGVCSASAEYKEARRQPGPRADPLWADPRGPEGPHAAPDWQGQGGLGDPGPPQLEHQGRGQLRLPGLPPSAWSGGFLCPPLPCNPQPLTLQNPCAWSPGLPLFCRLAMLGRRFAAAAEPVAVRHAALRS